CTDAVARKRFLASARMRMNRRTIIKLIAAVIANPVVSRLVASTSPNKLTNWAGNLEYSTDQLYTGHALKEVRDYVKKTKKLKVLGSRHSFNNIADSRDNLLSLKSMSQVIALDPK